MDPKKSRTELTRNNADARGRIRKYQARQDRYRRIKKKKNDDFLAREIDISDYIISPEGYESIVFSLYFLIVPYLVGLTVVFFYVADADFKTFQMIDFTTLFVVWMIGYEVIAAIILFFIFIAFLRSLARSSA
ncbi:MAG: hypothetical protein DSZ03_09200 [Sulfurimonas sp.]|nr:MAG: hypothetical protein DSZ03_09200 [Sulfurimonas sp.]